MSAAYIGPVRWDLLRHNAKSREFGDGPAIFSASRISYSVSLAPRSGLVQAQLLFVKFLVLSHTTFIKYQSWAEWRILQL